jgi:hypothetical protein
MVDRGFAPRARRGATGSDVFTTLFDFDLLVAAYQWDTFVVWQVTGCSPEALRAMRNHEIDVPSDLKSILEALWTLHFELWFAHPIQPYDYRAWWHESWGHGSPIGERSPLVAVAANPLEAIDLMIGHYRGMRSGDFS